MSTALAFLILIAPFALAALLARAAHRSGSLRLSTAAMAIETVQKHLRLADARSLCERQSQLGRDRRAEGDRESIEGWRKRLGISRQFEQAPDRGGRMLAAALTPGWGPVEG